MAIVRTPLGTGQAKSAAITVTIGNVIAAGDTIIAVTAGDTAVTAPRYYVSTADVTGTALTADATATNAGNVVTQIWRLSLPSPSVDAGARVTSPIATIAHALAVSKISGLIAAPKDGSSVGTGSGTSPSSGATGTLAQADELCIGAVGTEGPPSDAAGTWSDPYNAGQRDGTDTAGAASNITISEGFNIAEATTAQTAAKINITSRDWAAAIVTYKESARPTVALNTADATSFFVTTPTLEFTGTDVEADNIRYKVHIDTVNTFNSVDGLKHVDFYMRKFGSPADNLVVEILSGSPTGAVLGTSAAVNGSSLSTTNEYIRFTFATPIAIHGTKYYLNLTRSGARDASNYYGVHRKSNTSGSFAGGVYFKGNNVWGSEDEAADLRVRFYSEMGVLIAEQALSEFDSAFYGGTASSGEFNQALGQSAVLDLDGALFSKASNVNAGFVNTVTGGDTDPFNSGEKVSFTVQAGDELAVGTYYWRVRGLDPSGSGAYGAWSATQTFTITADSAFPPFPRPQQQGLAPLLAQ